MRRPGDVHMNLNGKSNACYVPQRHFHIFPSLFRYRSKLFADFDHPRALSSPGTVPLRVVVTGSILPFFIMPRAGPVPLCLTETVCLKVH